MDDKAPYLPHEPSDVDLKAVFGGVGIMAGGIVLALAGAWAVAGFVPSPLDAPNDATMPAIAGPVQASAPPLDLRAFMQEKTQRLHGTGVDPRTGEAFIPIEEAMKAMASGAPSASRGESR